MADDASVRNAPRCAADRDRAAPSDAPRSSRNALRGGVLAALSGADAETRAQRQAAGAAPVRAPARTVGSVLRAAGRRGLRLARPLALPVLNRMQARIRTALDGSDVAIRLAEVERALARLSDRLEAEAAGRNGFAAVRTAAAENARRLGAVEGALAETARHLASVAAAVAANAARQGTAAAHFPPIPVGDDVLVRTPDGALLVPAEDPRFPSVAAEGGLPGAGTRRVLAALLRPGAVFLDVGAGVGAHTLLAARAVGPAGRVVAVEPAPRLAALLRRTVAVNDVADRVLVADCAAGDRDGEATLHLALPMGRDPPFPPDGAGTGRAVRVRPADALVPAGTPVQAARIEAEGAELRVWRGMRRILAESPDLAAVLAFAPSRLARAGVSPEAWLREAQAPGFAPFIIDEDTGACRPATVSALADVLSANVLLLRPGAAARHPGLLFT